MRRGRTLRSQIDPSNSVITFSTQLLENAIANRGSMQDTGAFLQSLIPGVTYTSSFPGSFGYDQSPTELLPGSRHHHHHRSDYDCIPREIISLKQATDSPIDPIFDMLGEREFLIKKLHLKPRRRHHQQHPLLSQIR